MAILIDGYNLLHATGYIPVGSSHESLAGPRREFLSFLLHRLTAEEARGTTVVFDAANAPPGLPREVAFGSIKVLFAHNHAEADDLIEELIRANNVPQRLTVVSSDHRLHQAARRRRATVVDSDQWYWAIRERQPQRESTGPDPVALRRDQTLNEAEINEWLSLFGDLDTQSLADSNSHAAEHLAPVDRRRQCVDKADTHDRPSPHFVDKPKEFMVGEADNIFPPGYGEDLLEDSDDDA